VDKVAAATGAGNFRPPQPQRNRSVSGCAADLQNVFATSSAAVLGSVVAVVGLVALVV